MISDSTRLKLLSLLAIGICDAIRCGHLTIRNAELLLFAPHAMDRCQSLGNRIVKILHMGTELDDIQDLVPDEFAPTLERIRATALDVLADNADESFEEDSWIDLIMPRGEKGGRNGDRSSS